MKLKPYFKDKVAIVFAVDEKYIGYLSVCLESFKEQAKSGFYDIIILETNVKEEDKKLISKTYSNEKIKIRFVNLNCELEKINQDILYTRVYLTIAMYFRFFIPKILQEYEKAIYCDCDILFFEDIISLYSLDMQEYLLAGVIDTENLRQHYIQSDFVVYCKDVLCLKNTLTYFQSGVLVFNIKKCLKEKFLEQCLSTLASLDKPIYPDQDVLNIVAQDKFLFINPKYNVENHIVVFNRNNIQNLCPNDLETFQKSLREAVVLHFSGDRKPWNQPLSANAKIWWNYARKSPFYEEILYDNIFTNWQSQFKQAKFGAVLRVKNMLSYRFGLCFLKCKNPCLLILLPLFLLKEFWNFKYEQRLYKHIVNIEPSLEKPFLEDYADYEEALKVKKYLGFRLGQAFLKNPLTFVFKIPKIYKEFKQGRNNG